MINLNAKPPRPALILLSFVMTLAVSLTACVAQDNGDGGGGKLDLTVDDSPLNRGNRDSLPTSYAPIIENVSASVVNVFSTSIVEVDRRRHPFFNNPFFRRFYDAPRGREDDRKPEKRKQKSRGSGLIVTSGGYVLTNHHVVKNADEVKVALAEKDQEFPAKIVGSDPETDLAVLKIQADRKLPAATLADSDKVRVGDVVFAIGNPFGVGKTVTKGIVSAMNRGIGMLDYEKFIQTDASINPGNSGGPLIDAKGRVIGINTVILSRSGGSQGVGFSIPINLARSIARRIVQTGGVSRGFLGVQIQEITPELRKRFGIKQDGGVLITEAMDDMPAQKAGLKRGDVIVSFNGKKVTNLRELRFAVAQTPPGKKISVTVVRDGSEKTVELELAQRPDRGKASAEDDGALDLLAGVSVQPISLAVRQRLELPENVTGLIVTGVDPTSPAADAGLREGDVIREINRKNIKDRSDAREALRSGKSDSVLLYVWRDGNGRYVVIKEK